MDHLTRVVGPLRTNLHLLADSGTREAIAIDAAIPCLDWVVGELAARSWRLVLIVSTHGHWDHTGENAALQAWSRSTAGSEAALRSHGREHGLDVEDAHGDLSVFDRAHGAEIAAHPSDWHRLTDPKPLFAPFPIPPCIPAVELAEGSVIRLGEVRLEVLHTPGHTEGSVCLLARDAGLLFTGDTLFPGGWGRVDLPGGDGAAMAESLARLAGLPAGLRVLPGHGPATSIGRERPWLDEVASSGRLPF
jgi:hydroxyacylglutathione hydrolase